MNVRYNIGDKVWIMYGNVPTELEITSIQKKKKVHNQYSENPKIEYNIVYGLDYKEYIPSGPLYFSFLDGVKEYVSAHYLSEDEFYDTKKELLDSLL